MSKRGAYILVVDDELEIVRVLKRSLLAHGYKVFTARNGRDAVNIVFQQHPDLMLLDLLLPDMSGLEVCQRVRASSDMPIIVLSIKETEQDKVRALDLGADDYVPKPFGINEVLARVRVALRHVARIQTGVGAQVQIGPLTVDIARRQVWLEQREVQLTPTEYDLLKAFLTHRGKILTRQMLLKEVWGDDAETRSHSLHVYVAQLRRKIEPLPEQPRLILTVPGIGYRLNEELETTNIDAV